ncbi:hypothetical protein Tco_0040966 [Tanacetum coccineum]
MILSPQNENTEAFETDESALHHPPLHNHIICLLRPISRAGWGFIYAMVAETMTTVNQGMSVEEIERVVAQRVANAIEAIAIYETKTNMAVQHSGPIGRTVGDLQMTILLTTTEAQDKSEVTREILIRLNIISCTKTQKYMEKGFSIFLAHVTAKEVEDKSEKKRLEDVPIVRDFPEVFPEDLPGLPPTRQVEFQIDLGATLSAAPYSMGTFSIGAFPKMKELSCNLKELFGQSL